MDQYQACTFAIYLHTYLHTVHIFTHILQSESRTKSSCTVQVQYIRTYTQQLQYENFGVDVLKQIPASISELFQRNQGPVFYYLPVNRYPQKNTE